ncbi:MAG: DNA repair protein RecN [Bacteroidales bacterium]
MLTHLSVKNYALIRHLEIDFKNQFSVITGETGAGKSILMGALDLILGKRADTKVLLDNMQKCVVEGTFTIKNNLLTDFFKRNDIDFEEISILRREITPQGKSRAFINDTPVNLNTLKELGDELVDLHSQHQNLVINDNEFQLLVVDSFAGIVDRVANYRDIHKTCINKQKELVALNEKEKQSLAEKDYLEFILNELTEARLTEDEQDEMEKELALLNHAEEIKSTLYQVAEALGHESTGIVLNLSSLRKQLTKISTFSESFSELNQRLESAYIELSDILSESQKIEETILHDPARIQEITDRLNLIFSLQNKHRVNSTGELLEIKKSIDKKLDDMQSQETAIEKLKREVDVLKSQTSKEAEILSEKRSLIFSELEQRLEGLLHSLGMPDAKFRILKTRLTEPGLNGIDDLQFLFNANKGGELMALSEIASGGEKSRLMLAIKSLLSQKNLLPTIIFDEIDTGVSGAVADKVGHILQQLAHSMQVIAISHLPQIAGKGNHHYLVYKETFENSTFTGIKLLNQEERIIEIAKLLSGQEITSASMESAKHLLKN